MVSIQIIRSVNAEVNRRIAYGSDLSVHGRPDWWTRPEGLTGDCEDYVLEKLARLKDLGAAQEDMTLVLCTLPGGEYHCVLSVRDEDGRFWVLDNRHPLVRPWNARSAQYRWDKGFDWASGQWRRFVAPV